jgi:hypothetical protein
MNTDEDWNTVRARGETMYALLKTRTVAQRAGEVRLRHHDAALAGAALLSGTRC